MVSDVQVLDTVMLDLSQCCVTQCERTDQESD